MVKDKRLAVLGANNIEGVEETPCACITPARKILTHN
jgi:hypothetical protein